MCRKPQNISCGTHCHHVFFAQTPEPSHKRRAPARRGRGLAPFNRSIISSMFSGRFCSMIAPPCRYRITFRLKNDFSDKKLRPLNQKYVFSHNPRRYLYFRPEMGVSLCAPVVDGSESRWIFLCERSRICLCRKPQNISCGTHCHHVFFAQTPEPSHKRRAPARRGRGLAPFNRSIISSMFSGRFCSMIAPPCRYRITFRLKNDFSDKKLRPLNQKYVFSHNPRRYLYFRPEMGVSLCAPVVDGSESRWIFLCERSMICLCITL